MCTYLACTDFFLPDLRVIGLVASVVLPGSRVGVTSWRVAEFGEHPGAEDGPMPGWERYDLSVRVPAKMRLDLPLQGLDLLVEDDQDRKA